MVILVNHMGAASVTPRARVHREAVKTVRFRILGTVKVRGPGESVVGSLRVLWLLKRANTGIRAGLW